MHNEQDIMQTLTIPVLTGDIGNFSTAINCHKIEWWAEKREGESNNIIQIGHLAVHCST